MKDNWADCMAALTYEESNLVRHGFCRKPDNWTDVDMTVTLPVHTAEKLKVMIVEEGQDPMDDLPDQYADSVFIAQFPDGEQFLVNTEGFNYCRYVAKLELETQPS